MTYRADPVTQRDGSSLANSNCLMAAAAVGLDYHTLGRKTSTGKAMRSHSGDTSGGTNSDEIERAWRNGYQEDPTTRDGRPFTDVVADLRAGRLVMLQVWHATTGRVCLSGSGAYGHGMSVAPESRVKDGATEWLVADPWCKPPSWGWVRESKLKAGAEEWVQHSASGASSGGYGVDWPDPEGVPLDLLRAAARRLMDRYTPDHPSPFLHPPAGVGGAPGVLFVSTAPHQEADVSINANGSQLYSKRVCRLGAGQNFYADADLQDQLGEVGSERVVPYLGGANGPAPGVAVILHTSTPYDDGQDRDTVVYVNPEHGGAGEPYTDPDWHDPHAPVPPSDDVEAAVAARDEEWRAWLEASPVAAFQEAEAILAWEGLMPGGDAQE